MFLMASGTRFVLHYVRFVKGVLLMTGLAFSIDGVEGYSTAKPFAHNRLELFRRQRAAEQRFVMAFRAVVRESGVARRYLAGVKECLVSSFLKEPNRDQSGENG